MDVWPGDPRTEIRVDPANGSNPYQTTSISLCVHAGTHVDAPRHLDAKAPGIDAFPLDLSLGEALVIDVSGLECITLEALEPHLSTPAVRRVLLRTRATGSGQAASQGRAYAALTPAAAMGLVAGGYRLIGTDAPSIGADDPEGEEVHRLLLNGGVWILEGLDLSCAATGRGELLCLPLSISGADGAPARALLRVMEPGSE